MEVGAQVEAGAGIQARLCTAVGIMGAEGQDSRDV